MLKINWRWETKQAANRYLDISQAAIRNLGRLTSAH